jgi:hypothetical protein
MLTAIEKGNALEASVAAIEAHILNTSPALREKTFLIDSKKIISVGGVRHEIDIFVTINIGDGYTAVFIFECKNWQDAVGKNEIIIFAEKVAVSGAQHGYFVAKSFTKDARAQAATNSRICLLTASEHDPTIAPVPFGFHGVIVTPEHAEAVFHVRGRTHSELKDVDLGTVKAKLLGNVIDLRQYLCKWAEQASNEDVLSFRSERCPEGVYYRTAIPKREFSPGEFTLDERDIERAETTLRYKVALVRPPVISHFEVETRGRVVSLGPIQMPDGPPMQINIVSR